MKEKLNYLLQQMKIVLQIIKRKIITNNKIKL